MLYIISVSYTHLLWTLSDQLRQAEPRRSTHTCSGRRGCQCNGSRGLLLSLIHISRSGWKPGRDYYLAYSSPQSHTEFHQVLIVINQINSTLCNSVKLCSKTLIQ